MYLACLASKTSSRKHSKEAVEKALDIKLSKDEWMNIKKHALYPGPFKPEEKTETTRCRVPHQILQRLLHFLDSPGNTQRYAFGTQVQELFHGRDTCEIDRVSLTKKLMTITTEFIMDIPGEFDAELELNLPDDGERCTITDRGKSCRRCRRKRGHDGKCQYTPKGSICFNTAMELVRSLTVDDVKRLAGLDDVKVLKGRDNWKRARTIANLAFVGRPEEAKRLIKRVDDQEVYYNTDFIPHLQRESDHKCNCLTCGFYNEENTNEIICTKRHSHAASCTKCAEGFQILDDLAAAVNMQEQELQGNGTRMASILELQQLDELKHSIGICRSNLHEYRGHLARHLSEDEFAVRELAMQASDQAIITSDYKMKILSCFFRENQRKWFGKRGTPMLGFMIVTNPTNEDDRAQGLKDVKFVMLLTNDLTQDDWAVACAKAYIYENELPSFIKRAIFIADGAGCFKSKLHRGIQKFWKVWTGITEDALRITPAGDGKSNLDGMFGRTNVILGTAVDNGCSYHNAETILLAVGESNGLAATVFKILTPMRDRQFETKLAEGCTFSSSVLLTILEPTTGSSQAYKHSGYGAGFNIGRNDFVFRLLDNKGSESIIRFYDQEGNLDNETVTLYKPSWKGDVQVGLNKKQSQQSTMAKPGEGANSKVVRQQKQKNCARSRAEKKRSGLESIRYLKRDAGLFLCDAKCSISSAYCKKTFLDRKGLANHQANNKHEFPKVNARDWLFVMASKPGGSLAVGNRPNRRSNALFEPIQAAVAGSKAEVEASCLSRFNRNDKVGSKGFTERQIQFLVECFNAESKMNAPQIEAKMKTIVDPTDGGLLFCNAKANLPTNGSCLTQDQINSWLSSEVKRRENGKDASMNMTLRLQRHFDVIEEHQAKNPDSYWKVCNEKGSVILASKALAAVAFLFDVKAKKACDKRQELLDLSLDQSSFDAKLVSLKSRIHAFKTVASTSVDSARSQNATARAERLLQEDEMASSQASS